MTGHAAQGAGRAAAEHLRGLAAEKFAVPAASVRLEGGRVHTGDDSTSIGDLVAAPDTIDGTLSFDHRYQLDLPFADPSGFGNLSPTYAFAAHAVEVEVDRATGRVHVVRVVAMHDSGTISTRRARGEVITHIVIPAAALRRTSVFEKLRLYDGGFALVAACVSLSTNGGTVAQCRAVLGTTAPTPYRAVATEKLLVEAPASDERIERAAEAWTSEAHPLQGTAWKLPAASAMLARCIRAALVTEQGGRLPERWFRRRWWCGR